MRQRKQTYQRSSRTERCLTLLTWDAETLHGFTGRILTFEPRFADTWENGIIMLVDPVGHLPPGLIVGPFAGGLIRMHLLLLPVPLKWFVSETRNGGIKGRSC